MKTDLLWDIIAKHSQYQVRSINGEVETYWELKNGPAAFCMELYLELIKKGVPRGIFDSENGDSTDNSDLFHRTTDSGGDQKSGSDSGGTSKSSADSTDAAETRESGVKKSVGRKNVFEGK